MIKMRVLAGYVYDVDNFYVIGIGTCMYHYLSIFQLGDVVDAMFERRVQAGDVVIRKGDDGDNFYVIDTGTYSVRIQADGQEKTVCWPTD